MEKNSNERLKWTEEKCYEVAKKCSTKTELKRKYCCAYRQAKKNGWLKDYIWFRTTETKWTKDICLEIAKGCRSKTHFSAVSKGAYNAAIRHGWVEEYTWFNPNYGQHEIKWTEERCYEAAKECGNVTEFREKFYGAYSRSKKYGWIEQYTWFQDGRRDIYKKVYTVYAYEDVRNKRVYIGLTNNIKRRVTEHKKKDYKHSFRTYDRVREYFESIGTEAPKPVILIEGIDGIEAQEKEGYYVKMYADKGWDVINLSKTGKGSSSLGNVGLKWTYEECERVAKKCSSRKELEKNHSGALDSIRRNGWVDLLPPKREVCKMTKEECIDFCKGLKTMEELKEVDEKVYRRVKNKKWVLACFPHKIYSEAECREKVKKYSSFTEATRNDSVLGHSIKKLGLERLEYRKDITPYYTKEEIKEICSRYNGRTQLLRENYPVYKFCKENNLLDEMMPSKNFKWTLGEAIEEAKKYKWRDEFRTAHHHAYDLMREHGLLEVMFPKRKPVNRVSKKKNVCEEKTIKKKKLLITENDCFLAASKCEHKREFREKYPKEYAFASRNKWLGKYTWLKGCKHVLTNKECVEAAKKCKTKGEFREKYQHEYEFARKNDLLQCFTWLKRKKVARN